MLPLAARQPRTRRWLVALITSVAVIIALTQLFVLTDIFIAPQAHEVHSPNAIRIQVQTATSDSQLVTTTPTESLADLRCQVWHTHNSGACPDDATLALAYWPQLSQSSKTLYLTWRRCRVFNVEYIAVNRTLVIHCYTAESWLPYVRPPGVVALSLLDLLVVPTDAIAPGSLSIVEDDRVEHFAGDQSTMSLLGTVTVS